MLLHDWVEANLFEVAKFYRAFEAVEPPLGSGAILAIRGTIKPLDGSLELVPVLEDLACGNPVLVQGGTVLHDPDCTSPHSHRNLDSFSPDAEFEILCLGFPPKHHPKAFSISPEISRLTFPAHPHLFMDGSICADHPSDALLPWDGRTCRHFLTFVSIWLAKHMYWVHTGGDKGGRWLGDEAGHSLQELLAISVNAPCPCGKGLKYKRCCRELHEQQLRAFQIQRAW